MKHLKIVGKILILVLIVSQTHASSRFTSNNFFKKKSQNTPQKTKPTKKFEHKKKKNILEKASQFATKYPKTISVAADATALVACTAASIILIGYASNFPKNLKRLLSS